MSSTVRPYDAVGRYGVEEFLIVLPGSDGLGALTVAERIRESFVKRPLTTTAGPVPMTLSLGVASEGGEGTTETSALLRAASAALKRAQQGGKNRTALADDSGVAIDAVPDGG
jgi:diguanylate cyclase (GGDEF)-like protein